MRRPPDRCAGFRHRQFRVVWSGVSADVRRYLTKSPENAAAGDRFKTRLGAVLTPQLLCLIVYRLAHWLWVNRWRRLAVAMSRINAVVHKVDISPESCIGPGCLLPHPVGVSFAGSAGRGLTLYASAVCCPLPDGPGRGLDAAPRLGDRVSVGGHSAIVGPVVVGDDAKVGFNIGLERDVPRGCLVLSGGTRVRLQRDGSCTSR